ncbi:hypothetical protein HYH03_018492 [Edaphochlamys debaryana]|uniref:Uncharacterized protein n=1 Tax=Edaphochlamys debaryana TaxID=47281 RepID=A0A835XDN1_9CHLO|nr:hypothetical protein HYH03_018492 [Edaphochlamys debaryana]|eukprot:KAG2482567.1 hypothetical protein HYH03_018492 [Edaphochlamys debaryana]
MAGEIEDLRGGPDDAAHVGSASWGSLPAELVQRIAAYVPSCSDVACGLRLVNKATAKALPAADWGRCYLSDAVPEPAFAARWGRPGAISSLSLAQRYELLRLVAASGSVANLRLALEMAQCPPPDGVLAAAAFGGHLEVCKFLAERFYLSSGGAERTRRRWCWREVEAAAAAPEGRGAKVLHWAEPLGLMTGERLVAAAAAADNGDLVAWALDRGTPRLEREVGSQLALVTALLETRGRRGITFLQGSHRLVFAAAPSARWGHVALLDSVLTRHEAAQERHRQLWMAVAAVEGRPAEAAAEAWLRRGRHECERGLGPQVMVAAAEGCSLPTLMDLYGRLFNGGNPGDGVVNAFTAQWVDRAVAAAAASPTPDWREKVEWLASIQAPRWPELAAERARLLPDAPLRTASLASLGYPTSAAAAVEAICSGDRARSRPLDLVLLRSGSMCGGITFGSGLAAGSRNPRDGSRAPSGVGPDEIDIGLLRMWLAEEVREAAGGGCTAGGTAVDLNAPIAAMGAAVTARRVLGLAARGCTAGLQALADAAAGGAAAVAGGAWAQEAAVRAARGGRPGHLEALKWLEAARRAGGCDSLLSPAVFAAAAGSGGEAAAAAVRWLGAAGCAMTPAAWEAAAAGGSAEVLDACRVLGCPRPLQARRVTRAAIRNADLATLRALHGMGFSIDWAAATEAAQELALPALAEWANAQRWWGLRPLLALQARAAAAHQGRARGGGGGGGAGGVGVGVGGGGGGGGASGSGRGQGAAGAGAAGRRGRARRAWDRVRSRLGRTLGGRGREALGSGALVGTRVGDGGSPGAGATSAGGAAGCGGSGGTEPRVVAAAEGLECLPPSRARGAAVGGKGDRGPGAWLHSALGCLHG